jgi:hypothetical protein
METIFRKSVPSKHDQLPKGTRCIVEEEPGKQVVYEQQSSDEDNPIWVIVD